MTEYVTTNIRLTRAMHDRIKQRAQEENKSFAQVVRESVTEYLTSAREMANAEWEEVLDPIYTLADLARPDELIAGARPTDTSIRHDYYLYGLEKDDVAASEAIDE